MTSEELRALDAEIIQKMFGYTFAPADPWDEAKGRRTGDRFGDRWVPPTGSRMTTYEADSAKGQSRSVLPSLPRYSQDMTAALLVADAMQARGSTLVLEDWRDNKSNAQGWAAYFCLPDGGTSAQRVAATAPLAVCRAALAAVVEPAAA